MDIILYTIGCPKCDILKEKLENKNIKFNIIDDKDTLIKLGFDKFPKLSVDGNVMDYMDAIKWLNSQEGEN